MLLTAYKTIDAHMPGLEGTPVLAAVSGGADSVALALMLHGLGANLSIAHVHHGIRSVDADADARFVRRLARRLDVPFHFGKFDVPADAQAAGESLEMAARRIRRDFLLETASRAGIPYVATGHTADDQAETILLRIIRGTSITGLAGIAYCAKYKGVHWIRPLRDVTRQQILGYLKEQHQAWCEDATNADDFAMRNRIRNEVLPLLETRLNPAVRQALIRLADIASAENEVMTHLAKITKESAHAPLAIQRRQALARLREDGEKEDFHSVEKTFPRHGKKSTDDEPAAKPCAPWAVTVDFSGPWKKAVKKIHVPEIDKTISISKAKGFRRNYRDVFIAYKQLKGRSIVLRSWRPGDRMKPMGMDGSRKLSDIFTDLKIQGEQRNRWMLVECDGKIAALIGWRVARDFAVPGPLATSVRIGWHKRRHKHK